MSFRVTEWASKWVTEWASEWVSERRKIFRSKIREIFISSMFSIHSEKASNCVYIVTFACATSVSDIVPFVCAAKNFMEFELQLNQIDVKWFPIDERTMSARSHTPAHTHTHAYNSCVSADVWRLRNLSVCPSLVWQLSLPIEISCRCAFHFVDQSGQFNLFGTNNFCFFPINFICRSPTIAGQFHRNHNFIYLFIISNCAGGSPFITSCWFTATLFQ